MRIVGGRYRGRKLRVPQGQSTRPTTERVREALFNVLGEEVHDLAVLDLYAGSGSLGLEALSRGAARVVFVEMAHQATSVIRENLTSLDILTPVAQILERPIDKCLDSLKTLGPFDLCLVDPPFAAVRDHSALRTIDKVVTSHVLRKDSLLVLEYPSDQPEPVFDTLALQQVRKYGDTRLAFFRLKSDSRLGE